MSDEASNELNNVLKEGLKRGAYAQIGGQAANNSGGAYAQKVYAESPPSLIAELRNRKAKTALLLGQNEDERKRLEAQYEDLDRAISALTPAPAPEAEPGSGHGEIEIPEGFTKWEGGTCPVKVGDDLRILWSDGFQSGIIVDAVWAGQSAWEPGAHDSEIYAYRIISEPAGEGETRDEAEAQPATPYADSCILKTTQQDAGLMGGYAAVVDAEPAPPACTITFDDDTPEDERKAVVEGWNAFHRGVSRDDSHMREDLKHPWRFGYDSAEDPTGMVPEMFGLPPGYQLCGESLEQARERVRAELQAEAEPAPLIIADPSSVEELGEQSEPFKMEEVEADEPLSLDQLDEAGITDPDASAMLRMMTARVREDA